MSMSGEDDSRITNELLSSRSDEGDNMSFATAIPVSTLPSVQSRATESRRELRAAVSVTVIPGSIRAPGSGSVTAIPGSIYAPPNLYCRVCRIQGLPTKHVVFHQHIGALVLRFEKKIEGWMCKACIREIFWEYTLITLFFGWWGIISFFMTPLFLTANVIQYRLCRDMIEPVSESSGEMHMERVPEIV